MRTYVAITGAIMAVVTFLAVLYLSNQRYTVLTTDLGFCLQGKADLENRVNEVRRELRNTQAFNDRLQDTINSNNKECPVCTNGQSSSSSSVSQPSTLVSGVIPGKCWENTPLYKDGFECGPCQRTEPENWPFPKQTHICDYLSLGGCCHYRHLLGESYATSPQLGWGDLMMLDFAFTAHPHHKNVVEFGTYLGVTSLHLAQMAALRGGNFHSFDISDKRGDRTKAAWENMSNMKLTLTNLLVAPYDEQAKEASSQANTFFFFDNGDKTSETNTYSEFLALHKDAAFCTHDWGYEITYEGIKTRLDQFGFKPFAWDHAEMLGAHVRCFSTKKFGN